MDGEMIATFTTGLLVVIPALYISWQYNREERRKRQQIARMIAENKRRRESGWIKYFTG